MAAEPTASEIASQLQGVLSKVTAAATSCGRSPTSVRLVAVSKFKSDNCVKAAYDAGHRVFGENYVQEFVEKSAQLPSDIQWHFIGHLQSNKVKELLAVASLEMVETIDSSKLADKLNNAVTSHRFGRPLGVLLQVNTSGEESKSGVDPGEPVTALASHIATKCPLLCLRGVMTIGMPDYTSTPECFKCLDKARDDVAKVLQTKPELLELSMGMSGDYEAAIMMGSTNVRVGSSIFGARPPAKK